MKRLFYLWCWLWGHTWRYPAALDARCQRCGLSVADYLSR